MNGSAFSTRGQPANNSPGAAPDSREIKMVIDNYRAHFAAAEARTRDYGLEVPPVRLDPRLLLTTEMREKLPILMKEALGRLSIHDMVLQRISLHHGLRASLAGLLQSDVYLTLGWVKLLDEGGEDARLFEFDEEWIEHSLARGGMESEATELHAWLTLPSMEIIDLSLLSSVAIINRTPTRMGAVLIHRADDTTRGICYVPMLIGDDFLKRIGMVGERALH